MTPPRIGQNDSSPLAQRLASARLPMFALLSGLLAQTAANQVSAEGVTVTPGKSYTFDIFIVVTVVGIALFAICKRGPQV